MDAKKLELSTKQELLDKAFAQALDKLAGCWNTADDTQFVCVTKMEGGLYYLTAGYWYSEADLMCVADMFRHCTYKTLWNTFDSCNNYQMPKETMHFSGKIHYWYAEKERKARAWDLKYMKKFIPYTVFKSFEGMDHGDMALFYPDQMAKEFLVL